MRVESPLHIRARRLDTEPVPPLLHGEVASDLGRLCSSRSLGERLLDLGLDDAPATTTASRAAPSVSQSYRRPPRGATSQRGRTATPASRGYYADLIETKVLPGPNPAADLKHFIGKEAHHKARAGATAFFASEEAPQLLATARALVPRWAPFILTGLLAGLRWGESAALYRGDIDWKRGRIHVQRTWSDKAGRIEAPKDSGGRHVKASPALLGALRAHLEAMTLEGQVKDWTPEQRQLVFPNKAGRVIQ